MKLPENRYTDIKKLRNSWDNDIADKCMKILGELSNYYHIRDLVICTNRSGYIVETPDEHTYVFKDDPSWAGVKDYKSRLIADNISNNRFNPETFASAGLRATSMYDDFPHSLQASNYTGDDFWRLWEWLFNLSVNAFAEGGVRNYGSYVATSKTKELTILITKKKMIEKLAQETGLPKAQIELFLKWLIFNSQTMRKFTLFHCPLVEINENFLMILPHTVMMAYAPAIFLRLFAHHDKNAFDSASSYLEKQNLKNLKNHLEGQGHVIKTNIKLDSLTEKAEFDFVEYDESDSTLSIGQAKFTIRADSVAEVDHTNEVLQEGLEQLKRDKTILDNQRNIEVLFARLGISPKKEIKIEYFLLPTCFTGSDFLDIPNWVKPLPVEFCLQSEYKGYSIRSIWTQYTTLSDSLEDNAISSKTHSEFEIADLKISYPGFTI